MIERLNLLRKKYICQLYVELKLKIKNSNCKYFDLENNDRSIFYSDKFSSKKEYISFHASFAVESLYPFVLPGFINA